MRKLSGFTLVECLVALMVLGIASLTLAQVYAAVAKGRRDNEYMNYSLAEQMKYVEMQTASEGVKIEPIASQVSGEKTATIPAPAASTYQVKIKGGPAIDNPGGTTTFLYDHSYAYGVNMYILYSRDINNAGSDDATYAYPEESSGKLRYKYLLPRTPGQVS
ncbi:MAG: type II secretion system GspH family protein [Ruminococcus sp.]|jgi:prepilin-type N-terminal cleavage/methylation domain-containing protein|nr:type II secretion system GspH family protein [Ruminococcus sp.]